MPSDSFSIITMIGIVLGAAYAIFNHLESRQITNSNHHNAPPLPSNRNITRSQTSRLSRCSFCDQPINSENDRDKQLCINAKKNHQFHKKCVNFLDRCPICPSPSNSGF